MFYSQCNDCNERWELGTGSTCICPEQEPVAWISENAGLYHGKPDESLNPLPLYLSLSEGDIRALKHRIHELEGELMGYKKIVADQDALLERQTARIVDLQTHIENLEGEDR